jgi:hypothetical protein
MSETIEIRGRRIAGGTAEGEALVSTAMLSFWGEVDPVAGKVIAVGHPLEGCSLKDKVLVIQSTKGSSATPMVLGLAKLEGNAPAALVTVEVDGLSALGAIVHGIPMMAELERNQFECIRTGDTVKVDADAGVVSVTPRSQD